MFIDRDLNGKIVACYPLKQRDGQEKIKDDKPELIRFQREVSLGDKWSLLCEMTSEKVQGLSGIVVKQYLDDSEITKPQLKKCLKAIEQVKSQFSNWRNDQATFDAFSDLDLNSIVWPVPGDE